MTVNCHWLVVGLLGVTVLAISVRGEVPEDALDSETAFLRQQLESDADQHDNVGLLEAFRRSAITRIVVVGNYSVHRDLDGASLLVNRDVIITGYQGKGTVLDLQFIRAAVTLASNATVTFEHITIANDRRGAGTQYDIFVGQPGSKVVARNVYKLRWACVDSAHQAYTVSRTPRSTLFPGQHSNQLFSFSDIDYQGRVYEGMLEMTDYTADVPLTIVEGAPASGGYAVSERSTVRVCQHTVPQECLDKFSSDYCVNRLIEDSEAGTRSLQDAAVGAAASAGVHGSQKINPTVTAVAVLIGAIGTLLVLGLTWWLYKRGYCRSMPGVLGTKGCGSGNDSFVKPNSRNTDVLTDDIEAGVDQEIRVESEVWQSAGIRKGWEISYCMTTPLLGSADDDEKIQFVRLLGAGSFGRVYQARWAGRQCAVKVISHGADAAQLVENEVALMMAFNHPNIVKAYRCITYSHAPSAQERGSRGTGTCSTAGSMTAASMVSSQDNADSPSRGLMKAVGIIRRQGTAPQPLDQMAVGLGSQLAAAEGGKERTSIPAPPCSAIARTHSSSLSSASPAQGANAGASTAPQSAPADVMVLDVASVQHHDGSLCNTVLLEGEGSDGFQYQATDLGSTDIEEDSRVETWLILEYCDSGTLNSVVSRWQAPPDSDERLIRLLVLLQDTAHGLQELHKANVVHGDLNARNVLVSSSPAAQYGHVAKISDLGLSRTVKQHETHRTTNTVGTMSHMPPELLRYGRMSSAADVYAFGVMMWELYTGQQAFRKLHYGQFFDIVVRHNLRPTIPDHVPSDYRTLMEHCWATEVADRPTCESIVECLDYMVEQRKLLLQSTAAYRCAPQAAYPSQDSEWVADCQQRTISFSARSIKGFGVTPEATQGQLAGGGSTHGAYSQASATSVAGCTPTVFPAAMRVSAAAGTGVPGASDSSLHLDQQAVLTQVPEDSNTAQRKPGLLSQPVPIRRPRFSFGFYGSSAAAGTSNPATAAPAAGAGSVSGYNDARQLYMSTDEAAAVAVSPAAASTPIWIRNISKMQQYCRTSQSPAVVAGSAAEPAAAMTVEREFQGGDGMVRSPANHWGGGLPLFRSHTAAAEYKRPSVRMSVESNVVAASEASCQLSEPLPMSFTAQRENSQLLKRFWFV